MKINISELASQSEQKMLEPRDIFMSLPNKKGDYSYPCDVQTEVWKQWFEKRDENNTIIKMNTGSGKTVVGLIILQSCLNEGKGPAVYVVPDNYLVSRVRDEAKKLGIRVAYDVFDDNGNLERGDEDYYFKNKQAILITNIFKLVNGKSVFGMRSNGSNIPIGSIIIDDVHACMDTIEQQYSITIDSSSKLYSDIVKMFREHIEIRDEKIFSEIECGYSGSSSNYLIPFWIWQKCCKKISQLFNAVEPDSEEGKKSDSAPPC